MIFGSIRRAYIRYFRPAATSVSPKIDMDFLNDELIRFLRQGGLIPPDAKVGVRTLGIKPPSDPDVDQEWTWDQWSRHQRELELPGWAPCRFAHRLTTEQAKFVFGVVRGAFGLWQQPFNVCRRDDDDSEFERGSDILTCVTHLRSGMGIGVFACRETAAHACDLAERVYPQWQSLDFTDRPNWISAVNRTTNSWVEIGIRGSTNTHAHADNSGPFAILGLDIQSASEGKPEKLS